jgi:hypothetical protein
MMAKKRQASKRPKATGSNLDREILATLKEISRKLTDISVHQRGLRVQDARFDEGGEGGT